MKILVTGGAGCVGSELVRRLLAEGHDVTVFDNLSSGKKEHVEEFSGNRRFRFVKGDLTAKKAAVAACKNTDAVFHLAANSDIKYNEGDPTDEDLRLNTIATYNLLEAMRINNVKKIIFTSSSAVYGEAKKIPTPEGYTLVPISLYGASKAACETLISGFCGMFDMQAWIIRFANITGTKSRKIGKTAVSDFIEKLTNNQKTLEILGDGRQRKSYLDVNDCVEGVMTIWKKAAEKINVYNLGPRDSVTIKEIAEIVVEEMGLGDVVFTYTGGDRGWKGDVPKFMLDTRKVRTLGWKPKHTSKEAVRIAAKGLIKNAIARKY
jgi:UDP-glucose 4-epimerase